MLKDKIRILYLVTGFGPREVSLLNLATKVKDVIEFRVIDTSLCWMPTDYAATKHRVVFLRRNEEIARNIIVIIPHHVIRRIKKPLLKLVLSMVAILKTLIRIVKEWNPHLVLIKSPHEAVALPAIVLFKFFFRRPIIIDYIEMIALYDSSSLVNLVRSSFEKFILRVADRIVVPTQSLKIFLTKYLKINSEKILVIRSGIPSTLLRNTHDMFKCIHLKHRILGSVGNNNEVKTRKRKIIFLIESAQPWYYKLRDKGLVDLKGISTIVQAFAKIAKEYRDEALIMILINLSDKRIIELIHKLGLEKNVKILNEAFIYGGKMHQCLLNIADAFVVGSVRGSIRRACFERAAFYDYLATGKPVIVPNNSAIKELINEYKLHRQCLLTNCDIQSYVNSMKSIIKILKLNRKTDNKTIIKALESSMFMTKYIKFLIELALKEVGTA